MNKPESESFPARYWSPMPDGRVQCGVCPHQCRLKDGQRGICFVRACEKERLVLTTYGRSSGFAVDPIEKKPLHHFLPGSTILSFGTAGCNLSCKFCQNWGISRSREMDILARCASPEDIARSAREAGCPSVAFTYNDPVIFLEYAVDTAIACHAADIRTVAVTAGYICTEPRTELFRHLDAANVDLKAFTERFYRDLCGARLQPVLETLEYIRKETSVWLELTTLLIPGENDSETELQELTQWVSGRLGPDTPLHFTAFHPAWKLTNRPPTPLSTLLRARQIAKDNGLRHVYTGNVYDPDSAATCCAACGQVLIGRDGYALTEWTLKPGGICAACGARCAGVF